MMHQRCKQTDRRHAIAIPRLSRTEAHRAVKTLNTATLSTWTHLAPKPTQNTLSHV